MVTPGASFRHDLGADSLDLVELIMAIEEAFEIDVTDEHAVNVVTVRDAVELIQQRRASP